MNYSDIPWYDKVDWIREKPESSSELKEEINLDNPRNIYKYLDNHVYGHDSFKRKLSMFIWNMVRNAGSGNACGGKAMLVLGNSGTGKTWMFRVLSKVYGNIFIANAASMTPMGYKGESKLYSGLKNLDCSNRKKPAILVFDEWDKACSDTSDWAKGRSLQAEALKMIEGTQINIGTEDKPNYVDTSNVNFIFMGAFSDLLKKPEKKSMGFGELGEADKKQPEIDREALKKYGLTPEFMGRIQEYVVLNDLTEKDYENIIADDRYSPIKRLKTEFGVDYRISKKKRNSIAHAAFSSGEGVRSMYNQLLEATNEILFYDCECKCITIDG